MTTKTPLTTSSALKSTIGALTLLVLLALSIQSLHAAPATMEEELAEKTAQIQEKWQLKSAKIELRNQQKIQAKQLKRQQKIEMLNLELQKTK